MKKCPHCKLENPDVAQRCDCGYDFDAKTVKNAYFKQTMPKYVLVSLVVVIVLAARSGIRAVVNQEPYAALACCALAVSIYPLYLQLLKKKPWARIALMILAFPIGTAVLLIPEVKLFMKQKS